MDLYLASGNPHKLGEFAELFQQLAFPVNLVSAAALGGMPHVEENGETFADNARIKGLALIGRLPFRTWLLADDSGLCVDALGGAPGLRSARYAGEAADPAANNARLLSELAEVPEEGRSARFVCALVFMRNIDGGTQEKIFYGECEGTILCVPQAGAGFGYDPLFRPNGEDLSFAELAGGKKNRISHRGRAMRQLVEFLRRQGQ
ncbi:MAG: RdgB/HAM1 family non-canonical purine NTP pyrophosphatase [Verrucomicrobia bacterium]|jgi:XTP/dITP diphosphohydrolase|nr:RdgB/HAM1 family non-canonical purine NTP pyrophosphatase [Verrucomicrobiota bacterium]